LVLHRGVVSKHGCQWVRRLAANEESQRLAHDALLFAPEALLYLVRHPTGRDRAGSRVAAATGEVFELIGDVLAFPPSCWLRLEGEDVHLVAVERALAPFAPSCASVPLCLLHKFEEQALGSGLLVGVGWWLKQLH